MNVFSVGGSRVAADDQKLGESWADFVHFADFEPRNVEGNEFRLDRWCDDPHAHDADDFSERMNSCNLLSALARQLGDLACAAPLAAAVAKLISSLSAVDPDDRAQLSLPTT